MKGTGSPNFGEKSLVWMVILLGVLHVKKGSGDNLLVEVVLHVSKPAVKYVNM